MGAWLLKIVGIVFLGVMIDILYPNGNTNKFCKGIFSLITLFVIISPIFNLNIDNVQSFSSTIIEERDYQKINDRLVESQINVILDNMNIIGVNVEIDSIVANGEYMIENIYLDMSQVVLIESNVNINNYDDTRETIAKSIGVEKNKIIIYD